MLLPKWLNSDLKCDQLQHIATIACWLVQSSIFLHGIQKEMVSASCVLQIQVLPFLQNFRVLIFCNQWQHLTIPFLQLRQNYCNVTFRKWLKNETKKKHVITTWKDRNLVSIKSSLKWIRHIFRLVVMPRRMFAIMVTGLMAYKQEHSHALPAGVVQKVEKLYWFELGIQLKNFVKNTVTRSERKMPSDSLPLANCLLIYLLKPYFVD